MSELDDLRAERDEARREAKDACIALADAFVSHPKRAGTHLAGLPRLVQQAIEHHAWHHDATDSEYVAKVERERDSAVRRLHAISTNVGADGFDDETVARMHALEQRAKKAEAAVAALRAAAQTALTQGTASASLRHWGDALHEIAESKAAGNGWLAPSDAAQLEDQWNALQDILVLLVPNAEMLAKSLSEVTATVEIATLVNDAKTDAPPSVRIALNAILKDSRTALDAFAACVQKLPDGIFEQPTPRAVPLGCPHCGERHVDEGEWATRPHSTHLCANCAKVFRVSPRCYGKAVDANRTIDGLVDKLILDLSDRSGLDSAWSTIAPADRREIKRAWIDILCEEDAGV